MLRQRKTFKIVTKLDAFPKVPEEYTAKSKIGGTLSVISRLLILFLIYTEVRYYLDNRLIFKFAPDTDMDTKLKINIDLTVAMPCRNLGADILDSTNQNVFSFGVLEEEDTWWELDSHQRMYFDYMQHLNSYLREEYHSVANILYKGEHKTIYSLPERLDKPTRPHDACRLHGSLTLNKVAGNFHITAGKSLHFPHGHIHLSSIFDNGPQNFSHRIDRFSFGEHTAGIIQPLEGDERIITDSKMLMQYFIEVVPTDVQTFMSNVKTFQYSVRENSRTVDHDKDSHGIPGLYMKYDVSALKVIVRVDRDSIMQFIVRLGSIIAGIIVISGMINSVIQNSMQSFMKRFAPQHLNQYEKLEQKSVPPRRDDIKKNILLSGSEHVDVSSLPIGLAPSIKSI